MAVPIDIVICILICEIHLCVLCCKVNVVLLDIVVVPVIHRTDHLCPHCCLLNMHIRTITAIWGTCVTQAIASDGSETCSVQRQR